MKKLIILLFTAFTVNTQAQSFSDYEQYQTNVNGIQQYIDLSMYNRYNNDSMLITTSSAPQLTMRQLFGEEIVVSTSDNIHFVIHSNYYKIYVPEYDVLYTVYCLRQSKFNLENHLLLFMQVIRQARNEYPLK
jgi:hypothetical protein